MRTLKPSAAAVTIFLLSVALILYSVLRASNVCLTVDEAFTFQAYVKGGNFFPEEYNFLSANFHLLNVWLMIPSTKLFGSGELALRLPNILGHVLFLWYTAKFALQNKHVLSATAVFILLNVHPYLLDFFSLARGYGLSFGLLAGGLWYCSEYVTGARKIKHLVCALAYCGLAMWASFVVLHALLGAALMLVVFTLFSRGMTVQQKAVRIVLAGTVTLFFLVVAYPVMRQMQDADAFFYGRSELWNETICGLGGLLSYTTEGEIYRRQHANDVIVAVVLLLSFVVTVYAVVRNRRSIVQRNELLLLAGLFATAFLSIVLQHFVLGAPFPAARTGLFMFIIFLLIVTTALRDVNIPLRIAQVVCLCAVGFQLFFALPDLNLRHTEEWYYCADVKTALETVIAQPHGPGEAFPAFTVATDNSYGNIAGYYLQQKNSKNIALFSCSAEEDPVADFYIVNTSEPHLLPPCDTLLAFPSTALYVLRNKGLPRLVKDNTAHLSSTFSCTLSEPGKTVRLYRDTFTLSDTGAARLKAEAEMHFPARFAAGVFQFALLRNDSCIWHSYAVWEAGADSLSGMYYLSRPLPVRVAPHDVLEVGMLPHKDPGPIEISRFRAELWVEE